MIDPTTCTPQAIDPAQAPPHTLAAAPPPPVAAGAISAQAMADSGNTRDPNAPQADKLFPHIKNPLAISAPMVKPTLNHLRIAEERKQRGWTMAQCGKSINLGMNPAQLWHQYESGRVKRPKQHVAKAIAELFGLKLADIFIDPAGLIRNKARTPGGIAQGVEALPTSAANISTVGGAGINLEASPAMEEIAAAYTAGESAGYQKGYREGVQAAVSSAVSGGAL